jgi:hypothetical protein
MVSRIKSASILNYLNYNKQAAAQELTEQLGWTAYGGKHFESIYTRWVQGYLLPHKFGIDKRLGHLSDLINSGQITRSAALEQLNTEFYPDDLLRDDEYLLKKKLALNDAELKEILNEAPASFRDFRNSYRFVQALRTLVDALRRHGLYPK